MTFCAGLTQKRKKSFFRFLNRRRFLFFLYFLWVCFISIKENKQFIFYFIINTYIETKRKNLSTSTSFFIQTEIWAFIMVKPFLSFDWICWSLPNGQLYLDFASIGKTELFHLGKWNEFFLVLMKKKSTK